MSHICCESCIQDIESGYGEDLIDMGVCCCKGTVTDKGLEKI